MAKRRKRPAPLVGRAQKYSAVLLEFAAPLLATAPPDIGAERMQSALSIATVVWNAVLIDRERQDTRFVEQVRERMRELPAVRPLVEELIQRRETLFAEHKWYVSACDVSPGLPGLGGLTVRVEARGDPMP